VKVPSIYVEQELGLAPRSGLYVVEVRKSLAPARNRNMIWYSCHTNCAGMMMMMMMMMLIIIIIIIY
jgi:hypothetical protein